MHLLESREEWPAQREWERGEAREEGRREIDGERKEGRRRKKEEGARISMMINASCGGT